MSLQTLAHQHEGAWRDYNLSSSYLADFVLSELIELDTEEYSLSEILSPSAIKALLAYSCKSINAYRAGSALNSLGSGGMATRPTDEGRKLEHLLKSWSDKKWILISELGGENSFDAQFVEQES